MVSGPPRGIFENELLFLHSTPCFLGFSALFFREFSEFSACSPRAQRPFWTPRVPQPPCSKCCVKPGRWGPKSQNYRFLGCVGLFSGIGGGPKTPNSPFFEKNGLWPLEIFGNSPDFREFSVFFENYPENRRFSSENRVFSGIFGVF